MQILSLDLIIMERWVGEQWLKPKDKSGTVAATDPYRPGGIMDVGDGVKPYSVLWVEKSVKCICRWKKNVSTM